MERLHAKGLISDPVGKAKSVVFTEQGLLQSEVLFRKLFEKRSASLGSGVQVNRQAGPEPHPVPTCADGRPALLPSRPGPSQ
jgi:hypothetical protein